MTSKRRKMNDLNQRTGNLNGNRATVSSTSGSLSNRHSTNLTHTNTHQTISSASNISITNPTTSASTTNTSTASTSSPKLIRSAITFLEQEEENLVYQENEQLVKTDHSSNILRKLNYMRDDESL